VARRKFGVRRSGSRIKVSKGMLAGLGVVTLAAGVIYLWGGQEQASAPGDDALATGVRVGSGPFAFVQDFAGQIERSWGAADRVKALEAENQQLREWRQTAQALAERLARYEALLGMPTDVVGDKANLTGAVAARLVLDPGGDFKRTLLANAGGDHGVRRGYIAINENGLIGRVVSLGAKSSRILLLDDFNSRVPVMGLQSRVRAMMSGDSSTTPALTTGSVEVTDPRLDYTIGAGTLREGERVVTSGDGGVFPRGLLVGVAMLGADGRWRVRLAAGSRPIDFVRILPFARPDAPEAAPVMDDGPPRPPQTGLRSQVSAAPLQPAPLAPAMPAPRPMVRPAPSDPAVDDVDAPPPVDEPLGPPQ
jgi:rod shape-determining protein MreC